MPALTERQAARLVQLAHCRTTHEAIVCRADGDTARLAYLRRHSAAGLLAAVMRHGDAVCIFLGDPNARQLAELDKRTMRVDFGDLGHARFSGRTESEAIMAGELPQLLGQAEPLTATNGHAPHS